MFFYSRKSRQRSPEKPEAAAAAEGSPDVHVATPSTSNNNSTNKNSNPSNPSNSPPSNPSNSQSARGMMSATSSPSPNRRTSRDSEGYPSWLPKRPPPPAPTSTFRSSVGVLDFDQEFGVIPGRESHDVQRDPGPPEPGPEMSPHDPYFGGRKPTTRSVRIVSLEDPSADVGVLPSQGKRIHSGHSHVQGEEYVSPAANPAVVLPGVRALSRAGGAGILAAAQTTAFSPSHPKFNARGLHLQIFRSPSKLARLYFYLYPFLVFAHLPLQTFFDFNAVFILVQVSKYPNPLVPGVPGSGRNWALGAAAYIACWLVWILIVTILYEIIYSFFRRWRIKRPAIMPLYLSSSGFNYVCMSSYTNFCFMQHLRIGAFTSEQGSIRDGLAETFYYYSQNLPTVALLLPRAALCLALLFSYGRRLPPVVLYNTNVVMRRDETFFDPDGSLSGYGKGVLIANAAWSAWRILVLLCSWIGLWFLSGQGCAGLCGPRYRWEEEEVEKTRYSYLYGDAGSEDIGSTLAWSWRQCTRMRIQHAFQFCLTIERPTTWEEKKDGAEDPENDGVAQVMAAIGFPSPPQPARRSVLSGDLFEDPKGDTLDAGLPKVIKRSSKERQQLTEPYPFTTGGAQISSADKIIPFPNPSSESGEEDQGSSSAATSGSTDEVDATQNPTSSSSGKARESGSLSSFGQPLSSRYPFQFRQPAGGNGRAPQRPQPESSSPATAATSSEEDSTDSSSSQATQSDDVDSSEGTQPASSSNRSATSSIPMPPRRSQQAEGRSRARRPPESVPQITPATSSTIVHPVLFPRAQQGTEAIDTSGYEEHEHQAMDDGQSIASSHSEDDSIGLLSARSAQSARSPRPSLIASMIGGIRGSATASRTQSHSSGLSSGSSSGPSPSSARSFRSSLGSANVSVVGDVTANTGPRSRSRVGGSRARSRTSSASAYVRSRAQSLMQGIGAASQSSIDLVIQSAINRSRTNSMMARLDEGEHEHEGSIVSDTLRVPRTRTNIINNEPHVHDNGNEVDDAVEYNERISGLYDAQQQHADISYYSDGRTHSRSGSGSTSAMSSSTNENYTFGHPFPHRTRLEQVGEGPTPEEEGEQEEEQQISTAGQQSRASSGSVVMGDLHRATPDNSSSSSSSRSGSSRRPPQPTQPVPAALSPMRPRTYRMATAVSGEATGMVSPAAASPVIGSTTVEGSATESSVFTAAGPSEARGAGMHSGSDMIDRPDPAQAP
ncbi:hypothetical protein APHAL10511_003042 [Amanita phalloides]|nr:hypothetical protein APHAL10511_003042 [Amanita phalloides]